MNKETISFFDDQPMFLLDHHTLIILDVNDKAVEVYGIEKEDFVGKNIAELGEINNPRRLDDSSQDDDSSHIIWTHSTKEGTTKYIQFTSHVFNYNGQPAKLAIAHDVTELISEQKTNGTKFPKIQPAISNTPLAIIEWDKNLVIKKWSQKAEDLFGWKESEVVGEESFFKKFVHEDEVVGARERFRKLIELKDTTFSVEGKNYTKNGKTINCEWYSSLLYDENSELLSIYALVRDISERKQSEDLFKALSEESLVGVYLIQDGIFKYINPQFAEIFNYSREEIQGHLGPLDLTHPKDRKGVAANIRKRIEGEKDAIQYDFRCLTKDGKTIHVNVYGSRIQYKGEPAVVGTLVDITDSRLAFEQYRASVESFEDLFDSISDAIYIHKKDGRFIEVNKGAVDMYGYKRDYFIGKTPKFLAAPGKVDMEKTMTYVQKALEGEPQSFEWWGKRKNGEVFPKEVVLNPGTYFGEEVVIAIARDISDRYAAEEQIRKNEELFRQLFQNAHIGIVMMDEEQEIRLINKAFENIFGYSSEEIEGLDIDKLIVPEEGKEQAHKLSQSIFQGKSSNITAKRKRKDGSLVDVLIYGVPVNVDGNTIAIFGMYVDISKRKKAEEQVRKSLKEKEVLLAEIHHRVKNNLAVITGLLELQRYNTSEDDARRALYESQMRVNSIALIHEKLYQSEDLSQISFDIYMKELSDIIIKSISSNRKNINLDIKADPIELTVNQAIPCGLILNEIITNAFKHAFVLADEGEIKLELTKKGKKLSLVVEDDGKGLPDEQNYKNPGSLGMTLINTLTNQLNGSSKFENTGNGTRFELTFDYK